MQLTKGAWKKGCPWHESGAQWRTTILKTFMCECVLLPATDQSQWQCKCKNTRKSRGVDPLRYFGWTSNLMPHASCPLLSLILSSFWSSHFSTLSQSRFNVWMLKIFAFQSDFLFHLACFARSYDLVTW